MSVLITQTKQLGDGRVQVWGANPGGKVAHVIVGLDQVHNGAVYSMLQLAADKLDATASNLHVQSIKDSDQGVQ